MKIGKSMCIKTLRKITHVKYFAMPFIKAVIMYVNIILLRIKNKCKVKQI